MSSSSTPQPIPQGSGSVSDATNPPGSRVAVDQHGMGLPAEEYGTRTDAAEVDALEGELGTLHGCDGLTTGDGTVCQ